MLTVALHLRNLTRNTARFEENNKSHPPVLGPRDGHGSLYLNLDEWELLGKPEILEVTVKAIG